ncbi:MAG: hypothetical protein BWY72_01392 [Bacteroidetes bacterium ADurb.Bin416]|nr:MAG: hypothetical protein BWY72_01392 [Bacteroidetes bacterium ADurb.Bin416]
MGMVHAQAHVVLEFSPPTQSGEPEGFVEGGQDAIGFGLIRGRIFADQLGNFSGKFVGPVIIRGGMGGYTAVVLQAV